MPIIVTDAQVARLRDLPKKLLNPGARLRQSDRYQGRDLDVESLDGRELFSIYTRQSLVDPDDFSTGIRWRHRRTEITLARYNGPSHEHTNVLEREKIAFQCHIHEATERYQQSDRKPEGYAVATTAYTDLDGAFGLLLTQWNIGPPTPSFSAGELIDVDD